MTDQLITILREALELDENYHIQLKDNFREYDNWDSLAQLSLIAALDENFGVLIEQNEFKNIMTVEDLLQSILNAKK